ncbi:unnamed protein product, partial [Chrysoparadoxa australica]
MQAGEVTCATYELQQMFKRGLAATANQLQPIGNGLDAYMDDDDNDDSNEGQLDATGNISSDQLQALLREQQLHAKLGLPCKTPNIDYKIKRLQDQRLKERRTKEEELMKTVMRSLHARNSQREASL